MIKKEDNIETLLSVAGENFEYVRTIIYNKLEIKKLEMMSKGASIGSSVLMIVGISVLLIMILQLLLVLAFFGLYQWTGSPVNSLLLMIGFLLILTIVLYSIRRPLIQNFFEKRFEQNILSIQQHNKNDT